MASEIPHIPNLATILETLKAFAPPQGQVPTQTSDLEEGEYDPSEYDPAQALIASTLSQHFVPDGHTSTTPPAPAPSSALSTKQGQQPQLQANSVPSASSITTWPKALTYTIQHIFSNPSKKTRLRHLIQTQHQHERSWWTSRGELIRKAKVRNKSRQQLDSVLASVGAIPSTTTTTNSSSHYHPPGAGKGGEQQQSDSEEVATELATYDRKVHRASQEMMNSSIRELSDLGVPFFCTGLSSEKLDKKELTILRGKMLQLLEDYCGDQDGGSE